MIYLNHPHSLCLSLILFFLPFPLFPLQLSVPVDHALKVHLSLPLVQLLQLLEILQNLHLQLGILSSVLQHLVEDWEITIFSFLIRLKKKVTVTVGIYNTYLHGIIQFLFLPLQLDSLLLLLNKFLCLKVSRCTMLHCIVCILWVSL